MQLVCIKWGTAVSQYFHISNGVRQGGIHSPKLFVLYMNGLSSALSQCKAGCYINEQCMNHIMYADDICVMAPTAIALQKLLDVHWRTEGGGGPRGPCPPPPPLKLVKV